MHKTTLLLNLVALTTATTVTCLCRYVRSEEPPGRGPYRSPVALAFDARGEALYAVNRQSGTLAVVDLHEPAVVRELPIGTAPADLAVDPSGARVWVSVEREDVVAVVDVASRSVTARIRTGRRPRGLALASRAGRLFVANSDDANVSVIELATGREERRLQVDAEPDRLALTPDEQKLLVLCNSAGRLDRTCLVIDLASASTRRAVLPGSGNLRGLAVAPDGRWALVAHQQPKSQLPVTQIAGSWVFTNVV